VSSQLRKARQLSGARTPSSARPKKATTPQKRADGSVHAGSRSTPSQTRRSEGDIYETRDLKAIAARWDAKARNWDRDLTEPACHLNDDQAYERFLRRVNTLIRRNRAFCAATGVIDVGCGTGLVLADVVSSFSWGLGIDLSPKMIRLARARGLARTRFLVGDCFQLPRLCAKAGTVLSRGVLLSHYGPRQAEALLRAAQSTLVPGGFLLFDFLNVTARETQAHAPANKSWFGAEEARTLATRAGLQSVRILGSAERRVCFLFARRGGAPAWPQGIGNGPRPGGRNPRAESRPKSEHRRLARGGKPRDL
jgi:SAM-dependent methyltransferase